MGKKHKSSSLRSKAVNFVNDLTTGLLNPISDPLPDEEEDESKRDQLASITEEDHQSKDEPDTSSFSAFLGSLLSSHPKDKQTNQVQQDEEEEAESSDTSSSSSSSVNTMKETTTTSVAKKSLLSKYKQHFKNFYQAVKLSKDRKGVNTAEVKTDDDDDDGLEMKQMQDKDETATTVVQAIIIPETSEPSLLLTDQSRRSLYSSLPALVQGRKWILLYSTWRHGISLSTLYRKSLLWPGLSLLVVGDRKGSVFGGLVEAPLIPTDKKYQETTTSVAKKSLLSKYKQHFKNFYQAVKLSKDRKGVNTAEVKTDDDDGLEMKQMQDKHETATTVVQAIIIPETSEPSLLLTDQSRRSLYSSLPALVQGRKWILLYSTWRHGISLSTLYRKSLLWPGLSLLVVGDRKGSVFGGLVEAPLIPTDKKYQGTNSTFVFTDKSGQPTIYRPTGANRFYTLCSKDFLALGGGGRFALYLDSELLSGSSAYSETYGNACLATSQDFDVKEVELWGFVYGSKYDEILALSKTTESGICRW
ncbi:hypothetical protein DY000_02028111 [Brassica cretica]|uniref:Oxidation resistance protein 1 n=1 Tax=Brassica cretica TaxID=69181 RepID=A0ABQ7E1A3_BRACR|nr:hypothetical protein DY000_02028111 [Brassica cretica]